MIPQKHGAAQSTGSCSKVRRISSACSGSNVGGGVDDGVGVGVEVDVGRMTVGEDNWVAVKVGVRAGTRVIVSVGRLEVFDAVSWERSLDAHPDDNKAIASRRKEIYLGFISEYILTDFQNLRFADILSKCTGNEGVHGVTLRFA
jgi:hypothetical protein